MTVSEMLQLPALGGLQVLAGFEGLSRSVSTVTVMDAPDIYNWMKGGEFLITSAYAMKDDADNLMGLIEKLDRSGVAAFGIKISRFIRQLPQGALDTADRLGIPLISIGEEYAFADIINPVLYTIVNQQAATLIQAEKIHQTFLRLALRSADARQILDTLAEIIDCEAGYTDLVFFKDVFSKPGGMLHETFLSVPQGKNREESLRSVMDCYPLAHGRSLYGYILLPKGTLDEQIRSAVEYAGIVLTLQVQTKISNRRIEEKYRDEFISDLIYDNVKSEDEIINRGRIYGWDLCCGGVVAILDVNNIKKMYLEQLDKSANLFLENTLQQIFDMAHQIMTQAIPRAIYCRLSDHVVYIIPENCAGRNRLFPLLEEVFRQIRTCVNSNVSYTVSMGVGSWQESMLDIHKSFQQARTTVNLSYQLGKYDDILFYDNMGVYRLLAGGQRDVCMEYLERYILPVQHYDQQYHTTLFPTLQTMIRCAWNLRQVAQELYIHYNSAKYRYQKICELLNMDLRDSEQRLNMEIALRVYHMYNK